MHRLRMKNMKRPIVPLHAYSSSCRRNRRAGISLVEVLISMFVLLFGILGVAAMFPVGSYYVVKGEQLDRGAAVGQAALNDAATRGMLNPRNWIDSAETAFPIPDERMLGTIHAIAIDPLGVASGMEQGTANGTNKFPFNGNRTPVFRVTFRDNFGANQVMDKSIAITILQSLDDPAINLPDARDRAARLLFTSNSGQANIPLKRASRGDYSWMLTVSPAYNPQTGNLATGDADVQHNVSVVVFYKRDLNFPKPTTGPAPLVPPKLSEREVAADILSPGYGGGEIRLRSTNPEDLKGIRQGEWIMLYGTIPGIKTIGNNVSSEPHWIVQWYQIASIDEEVDGKTARLVSLKGPDWPWQPGTAENPVTVRAGLFRGAIAVYTRTMRLEADSPWAIPNNAGDLVKPN